MSMKAFVVPVELKKDRRNINVSKEANHFYKTSANRNARRYTRQALKQGNYDYQPRVAGYLS